MAEGCIFCNIKEGALVYRDDDGIVIFDDPVRAGHVLVGARAHATNLHELTSDDAAGLFRLANRVAKHVVSLTGASKVYLAAIGDKDKHFHLHLIPKADNDPNLGPYVFGTNGWISFLPLTPDAEQVAAIRVELQNSLEAS